MSTVLQPLLDHAPNYLVGALFKRDKKAKKNTKCKTNVYDLAETYL